MLKQRELCWRNTGINTSSSARLSSFESAMRWAGSPSCKKQLIELKGSTPQSVKEYQNPHLLEMIRRRLPKQEIQPLIRRAFWIQATEIYAKPHFYEDLKLLDMAEDFLNVIEKDILRTQKEEHIKRQARQVLQLFSHYNPYVGYCQGMNTIISFLVSRGFTGQQSFFIFKRVTEELLPCDYYSNMDNVMAYTRIFYEMLHITHPEIYSHLKKIGEEMQNTYVMMVSFVLQWFVCLFCNDNIYQPITEVIWDFFLLDGVVVLFKAALAYFDLLKPVILQCTDFESYNLMQKECIREIKNINYIRRRIIQTNMSAPLLFLLKEKLMQPNSTQQRQAHKKQDLSFRKSCHKNLNVCFQVLQDNLQVNKCYDFFVFKPTGPLSIIPNYLQTLSKQYFKSEKQKERVDSLVIGRIPHICRGSSDTRTEGSMSDKNMPQSQIQVTPKKSVNSTPKSNKSASNQESEKKIRQKVCQKIAMMAQKKQGMRRSQSIIFMEQMVKNVSISNLLEFYDIDELFQ